MSKELKESMRSMTTTSHQIQNLNKEEIIFLKKEVEILKLKSVTKIKNLPEELNIRLVQ